MNMIGRKLVLSWDNDKVVVIEVLVKGQTLYNPKRQKPQIYDIYEELGERIEILVGTSANGKSTDGQEISMLMPSNNPAAWLTEEEYEKKYPKK
jgi:hypothetical protein